MGVIEPIPVEEHRPRRGFTRGRGSHPPVPWFAIRWLWKNRYHLLASGLAKQDIDARDWMSPDPPEVLLERVAEVLGATGEGDTLCERLGRDLWIDYVADTGDDDRVSREVARLVAGRYRLPVEGAEPIEAPRGDVLVLGGDSAYPVATREEIVNRLEGPWNEILEGQADGVERPLLAVPGNHDWDDGLDGFGRLARRKDATEIPGEATHRPVRLHGYVPVQEASYFALPLVRGIDLFGIDRQLSHVDYRQRQYFQRAMRAAPYNACIVAKADPHRSYCLENESGVAVARTLGLRDEPQPHLYLAGDTHHYQRWHGAQKPDDLHVVAGGGGASLHAPPRRAGRSGPALEKEWPEPEQCTGFLWASLGRIATGVAGLLIPVALALVTLVMAAIGAWAWDREGMMVAGGFLTLVALYVAFQAWGGRSKLAALAAGLAVGLPCSGAVFAAALWVPVLWEPFPHTPAVLAAAAGAGVLGGFGAAVAICGLAWRGVDYTLAYAGLAHPGFKHFLRMRVHQDGSRVDVWCLGKHDPCRENEPVVLVDIFQWPERAAAQQQPAEAAE